MLQLIFTPTHYCRQSIQAEVLLQDNEAKLLCTGQVNVRDAVHYNYITSLFQIRMNSSLFGKHQLRQHNIGHLGIDG